METRTHQFDANTTCTATGYFRGDVGLNDSAIELVVQDSSGFVRCQIEPFTKNCGIKAISRLSGHFPELWKIVESFLFHVCRAGIVIGSDYTNGTSLHIIKQLKNWQVDEVPVWNPTYYWNHEHKVVVFRKSLFYPQTPNPWPDWKASPA